ncbi:MAG TPA: response regulator [bacterium]|nr:response regulator [bacterium]
MDEGWPFRTVILDLTIPGGQGGVEILKKLREIDPEIKAIVTSGYSHDAVLATYTQYGFIDTLAKPFSFDDVWKVLQKIRE